MPKIDTVVIGASAGGVEGLSRLVALLPEELPATVLVVIHFPERGVSTLPEILCRNGKLTALHAKHGQHVEEGTIYCAPPGKHLLLRDGYLCLITGPKENGNRPAIDPLFRSASHDRKNRVVSVLLSGFLDDGTMGSWAVQRSGGITICQAPTDALFGDLPQHAMDAGAIQHVLPIEEIAALLVRLVGSEIPETDSISSPEFSKMSLQRLSQLESNGRPSAYTCPECHGTLYVLSEEGVFHYRCRVGHSYMPDSLSALQDGNIEAVLWTALRSVEEHTDLLTEMLNRADALGLHSTAKAYRQKLAAEAHRLDLLSRTLGIVEPPQKFKLD